MILELWNYYLQNKMFYPITKKTFIIVELQFAKYWKSTIAISKITNYEISMFGSVI